MALPCLAAAGFAIDRLEGDSINKTRGFATQLLISVGCLSARLQHKKIFALASVFEQYFFVLHCVVGYLT
jgi:hypothetical protein